MTFSEADIAPVLGILRDAARREILPRFRHLSDSSVATKSAHDDLVTAADTGAEREISEALQARFPRALVIGEEAISADPGLRDRISDAELAFVIDPVDGTWNFAKGLATFGVILVATCRAEPVFGALYDPLFDDVIMAFQGRSARFVDAAGHSRGLAIPPEPAPGLTGFLPLTLLPEDKRERMAMTFTSFHRVLNLRCSAQEFRLMAQGHVDFMMSARLTPWDHAAGALIVARAGGHVRMLDGRPYRADMREGYLLAARSPALWEELAARFDFLLD